MKSCFKSIFVTGLLLISCCIYAETINCPEGNFYDAKAEPISGNSTKLICNYESDSGLTASEQTLQHPIGFFRFHGPWVNLNTDSDSKICGTRYNNGSARNCTIEW